MEFHMVQPIIIVISLSQNACFLLLATMKVWINVASSDGWLHFPQLWNGELLEGS